MHTTGRSLLSSWPLVSRSTQHGWLPIVLGLLIFLTSDVRNTRANGNEVDLALVLAVDISQSVNSTEYALQRGGLAYAIRHPDVIAAIKKARLKKIAVTVCLLYTSDAADEDCLV